MFPHLNTSQIKIGSMVSLPSQGAAAAAIASHRIPSHRVPSRPIPSLVAGFRAITDDFGLGVGDLP